MAAIRCSSRHSAGPPRRGHSTGSRDGQDVNDGEGDEQGPTPGSAWRVMGGETSWRFGGPRRRAGRRPAVSHGLSRRTRPRRCRKRCRAGTRDDIAARRYSRAPSGARKSW
jgi:hypothetical protein